MLDLALWQQRFCEYLELRQHSNRTLENYRQAKTLADEARALAK